MTERKDLAALMSRGSRRTAVPAAIAEPGLEEQMGREARGATPVWRNAGPLFPRSLPLALDERRYAELRRIAGEHEVPAAVVLRALIDLASARPELLLERRLAMREETAVIRRRRPAGLGSS